MQTITADLSHLLSMAKPSDPAAAMDFAVAHSLLRSSIHAVVEDEVHLGDRLIVGPFAFELVSVIDRDFDLWDCRWRKADDHDFVVTVTLTEEAHMIALPEDPNLYEVRDGRLAPLSRAHA